MLSDYVVLDLEMTGVNPKNDSITEIGAVRVTGDTVKTFGMLVHPRTKIPESVEKLTGITNEMVSDAADLNDAMKAFLDFSGDAPLVGHMITVDYSFVKQWAINKRIKYERMLLDTLKLSRSFLRELPSYKLENLCDYYGIETDGPHRALSDAKATNILYRCLSTEFEEDNPKEFTPKIEQTTLKKQTPITQQQIRYLTRYAEYMGIELSEELPNMTRSEASRYQDKLIEKYGKMPKESSI